MSEEYEVPFTTTNIKVEETKSNNGMDEPTKENQEKQGKLKDRKTYHRYNREQDKLGDQKVKAFINHRYTHYIIH